MEAGLGLVARYYELNEESFLRVVTLVLSLPYPGKISLGTP